MANKSSSRGNSNARVQRPKQSQRKQPGVQSRMRPKPQSVKGNIQGSGLLRDKVAVITGADSGIGRATAIAFAREGAQVAVLYLEETGDAQKTADAISQRGGECLLIRGNIGREAFCKKAIDKTVKRFGRLDILVNNAAEQHPQKEIFAIDKEQLESTFRTNVFSMFFLTKAALPHLRQQNASTIINTTSVTVYRGSPGLLDYSASKGAIVSFTRSLSQNLATTVFE